MSTSSARSVRRQAVLSQCKSSQLAWLEQPGRQLILFLDGTGNILGNNEDSNVAKLFRAADKSADSRQICFYDPGVGSTNEFPAVNPLESRWRRVTRMLGLGLGRGVFDNIAEGYRFLVENYQNGDRIAIFGFSRGAFTARAIGGMVNMFGLIHSPGLSILPYLVRSYFSPPGAANQTGQVREDFARDVIKHFSLGRTPLLHFVGVWDTVESVGMDLFGRGLKISNNSTIVEKRFVHVRHALALHETRRKYAPRLYTPPELDVEELRYRSFDQRWFRGNHADIGGSYVEEGLSNITLRWMMDEASRCGLRFAPASVGAADAHQSLHDQTVLMPFWVWTGLGSRARDASARLDPSALPLGAATPPLPMARVAPALAWLGRLLVLASVALAYQAWAFAASACSRGGENFSLTLAQLVAPWWAGLGIHCNRAALVHALAWDWAFGAAYALLLAYPLAWATRRAAPAAIVSGHGLGFLTRNAHVLMWALVAADSLENLLSYGVGRGDGFWLWLLPAALSLSSVIKFSGLALLLKVVVRPG